MGDEIWDFPWIFQGFCDLWDGLNQEFHLGFPTICQSHIDSSWKLQNSWAPDWIWDGLENGAYGTSQFFGLKLTRFGTENDQITW
jgi:hypothetical protein